MTETPVSTPEGFAPAGHVPVRTIGRGASSVVWEARRVDTEEPVAIKMLDADVPAAEAVRFLAGERADMPALAAHPNVLTVFEAGVEGERPWMVMELSRRGSLAAHVATAGPLDGPTAVRVLARLADALAVAHDAGVLHSNVKPANVLLTDAGEPALGDFGIAAGTTAHTDVRALGETVDALLPRSAETDPDPVRVDLRSLLAAMTAADGRGPATMADVCAAVGALAGEHGVGLDEPFPALAAPRPPVAEPVAVEPPPVAGPAAPEPCGARADGWSVALPAEQVATFVPTGSVAHGVPYSAEPDAAPLFTTPAPFRPRAEEEPQTPPRLPLVAAAVLGVLVTVGVVFGISQGRSEPEAPLSAVSPAVVDPPATTTAPPAETTAPVATTTAPPPASAEQAPPRRTTVQTRPRTATRAPVTRARTTKTADASDDDSGTTKKKKKKKSDD